MKKIVIATMIMELMKEIDYDVWKEYRGNPTEEMIDIVKKWLKIDKLNKNGSHKH